MRVLRLLQINTAIGVVLVLMAITMLFNATACSAIIATITSMFILETTRLFIYIKSKLGTAARVVVANVAGFITFAACAAFVPNPAMKAIFILNAIMFIVPRNWLALI